MKYISDFSLELCLKRIKRLLSKFQPSGKLIVILMIFVSISLWFYWFQWRPAKIRAECWESTWELVKGKEVDTEDFKALDFIYEGCLRGKGLK